MSVVEYPGDIAAFRNALRAATSIRVSERFDDTVITGIPRPMDWVEMLHAQLRILTPAIACGACGMLFIIQIALSNPASPNYTIDQSGPARIVDIDKLMSLIDKQGQDVASMALIEQCTVEEKPIVPAVAKPEPKPEQRACAEVVQNLV